jgi:hypothetical protein
MRARVLFVAFLLAAVHAGVACSDDKHRPEYVSGNCTIPPCGASNTVGQGNGSGGAEGRAETGADAGSRLGINCTTDPTSQLTLCAATRLCPDFQLDVVAFPGCGFLDSSVGIDLECVCNGTLLCPIGVQTQTINCNSIRSLVTGRTIADICNQVVNGTCRNLGGAPAVGQGGAASTCDRNCAATCPPNSPACLTSCGC